MVFLIWKNSLKDSPLWQGTLFYFISGLSVLLSPTQLWRANHRAAGWMLAWGAGESTEKVEFQLCSGNVHNLVVGRSGGSTVIDQEWGLRDENA